MAVILLTYKKYPKSSGGVAKHAEHLKRSFPQAKHFCWEDFPDHRAYDSISEPPKAKKLTHWLAERGHIVKSDLVIADGFWFADLKKIGCTIFSVIHGTFAGWIGQNHPLSQAQKDIIPNADRWIAVSPFAQYEAKKYYGINAEIILNGVDLSIFKPDPAIKKTFDFVDMATNTDKGSGLTSVLKKHFKGYSINGRGHKEIPHLLNQARVFVSPSRYEGNSYAILEAIACGLSIVSSPTGLFWT
ncbi:MAG: glycosyltransferase family 4 protein, partial [bacterium]